MYPIVVKPVSHKRKFIQKSNEPEKFIKFLINVSIIFTLPYCKNERHQNHKPDKT